MTGQEHRLRRGTWGTTYDFICKQKSPRKKMLALCGCCRVTWDHAKLECNHRAIEASEKYADGEIGVEELQECWARVRFEPVVYTSWFLKAAGPIERNHSFGSLSPQSEQDDLALREFRSLKDQYGGAWSAGWIACGIDVFGNVLNGAKFSRKWRTSDAVALARQMYESRDFSAIPIFADALQEAGCDNDDILNHCRDTSLRHVRGCWVVDFILGKK